MCCCSNQVHEYGNGLLAELPRGLRVEVALASTCHLLQGVGLFRKYPQLAAEAALLMYPDYVAQGTGDACAHQELGHCNAIRHSDIVYPARCVEVLFKLLARKYNHLYNITNTTV